MDTWSLLIGLIFGSVGLGYFIYGKKQHNIVALFSGLGLMGCPYLTDNKLAIIAVGVGLMLLPKYLEI